MNVKLVPILALISWFGAVCSAQETRPSIIFNKVIAEYQSMTTYSSEGTVSSDIDTGNGKITLETSFSIKLKKPNQYLITWNQTNPNMPFAQSGAVWNAGAQSYLYMGVLKAYSKMSNDEFALAGATGISSGAAFTVPSLFLPLFKNRPDPFSRLINPQIEGSEQLDGDDCYVVSSSSAISKKETFWISKANHIIRKYSRSLEPPAGGIKVPQMTDKELDDAIKAMGQEVTDARRQEMRDSMKKAQESVNGAKLTGSSTEVQMKINSPDLKDGDFAFQLPADAKLKDSLFEGAMGAK